MATAWARMKYDTTSSRADRTFELRTVSANLGRAITERMPMMLSTVMSSRTVNAWRVLRMKTPPGDAVDRGATRARLQHAVAQWVAIRQPVRSYARRCSDATLCIAGPRCGAVYRLSPDRTPGSCRAVRGARARA